MKLIFIGCWTLFLLSMPWARGDALRFVAGDRLGHKHTPWTVRLVSIDPHTGLAEFDFRVRDGFQRETIHVSRILSLYFSAVQPTYKDIELRRAVEKDIGGDLRKPRKVYVTEEFHHQHPYLLYVGTGRGRYIRGTILSFQNGKFAILAIAKDGDLVNIKDVFDFMLTGWVR